MKAAVYLGKGHFELVEKDITKPQAGEVLLEMSRAGICGTDLRIFQGHMQDRVGARRILGHEAVGIVRESGRARKFQAGDRVAIEPTIFCGQCAACQKGLTHVCRNLRIFGIDLDGAFQQFWTVPENRLHKLSAALTDDPAVMIEPLAVAVHAVRKAAVQPGETVAIIGAGTIGLLIALLCTEAGAKVIILETNPYRRECLKSLQLAGFDPTGKDAPEFLKDWAEGAGVDVLFEASGSLDGSVLMTALPAAHGRIILIGIHGRETVVDLYQIFFRELSLQGIRAYSGADFKEAIRLITTGKINPALLISKKCSLGRIQQTMEQALVEATAIKIVVDFEEK